MLSHGPRNLFLLTYKEKQKKKKQIKTKQTIGSAYELVSSDQAILDITVHSESELNGSYIKFCGTL